MNRVLYQDPYFVAFDKPAWWLTHPSDEARHIKENAMTYVRDLVGQYVYPINRLDLQASGIVLFAKSPEIVTEVKMRWDQCQKHYLALARGVFSSSEGTYDFELGNDQGEPRPARTDYKILKQYSNCAYVHVEIHTGRRHQIRRHFSRRMHALIGDRKYGKKVWNEPFASKFGLSRLFLHSHYLQFQHPVTNQSIEIRSPLPPELQQLIEGLNHDSEYSISL